MTKKILTSVSHDVCLAQRLKQDSCFAVEYLKVALEEASDKEGRAGLLGVMRQIAKAHGIAKIARAAGIKRESLSRALSPKGNPRFDTIYAVINALNLQFTVQPAHA